MKYAGWRWEAGAIVIALVEADAGRPFDAPDDAELLYEFEAPDWNSAMTEHHKRQDWEPYVPMDEDEEDEELPH